MKFLFLVIVFFIQEPDPEQGDGTGYMKHTTPVVVDACPKALKRLHIADKILTEFPSAARVHFKCTRLDSA